MRTTYAVYFYNRLYPRLRKTMKYTAAHWGVYKFDNNGDLLPIDNDPSPSPIGKEWVSAAKDQNTRILSPVVRKGWLDGDGGANRCRDTYIEVSWQEAIKLTA